MATAIMIGDQLHLICKYLSADLCFTAILYSFFYLFRRHSSTLRARSTEIDHMLGSECDLKTHTCLKSLSADR